MASPGISFMSIALIPLLILGVVLISVLPWAIRTIGDTFDEIRSEKSKDRPED